MADPTFDPYAVEFRDDPERTLAELRQACPVAHAVGPAPFVALLRNADILAALRDTDTWSSAAGPGLADERTSSPVNILVNSDPPRHSVERKLISGWFRPSVVARLEPFIAEATAALLDDFAPRGRGDVMAAVVNPLPLAVVSRMVGLAEPDMTTLRRWVVTLSASVGYPRHDMPRDISAASKEFTEYCRQEIARRRRDATPGSDDDMLASLLAAEIDGEALTEQQVISFMQFVLVAGTGTTSLLIGNLIWRLLQHPDQLALVRDRPELSEAAVEESLRFDAPALGLFRTPNHDVSIGGVDIPADTKTMVMFASANRDSEAWDDPERFDVTRDLPTLKRHCAFGFGIHFCLGAPLARLEGRIAIQQILQRLPDLRANGEPTRVPSMALQGFDSLPVAWRTP